MFRAVRAAAIFLLLPSVAAASHFRGGTIDTSVSASGLLTVRTTTLWRDAYVDEAGIFLANGARTVLLVPTEDFMVVSDQLVNPAGRDLIGWYARRTTVFSLDLVAHGIPSGAYLVRLSSCCRVDAIRNAPEADFSLESRVAYVAGAASGSPSMRPATIDIVARGALYTQSLLSVDPDRGALSYAFLVGSTYPDFGPTSQIPGIGLDADGIVSIPPANTASTLPGRWLYKVRVTDTSGAYSERDILVLVQDPTQGNTPPVLAPLPDAWGPHPAGSPFTRTLSGSDVDAAPQTVTVRSGPLPFGATMPDGTASCPGTATSQLDWTPLAADQGVYNLYFETWDANAADTLFTPFISSKVVRLTVADHRSPTFTPFDGRCVVPQTPISIPVTATDPDGTAVTLKADFLPAGATFPTVTGTGTVTGTLAWTPTSGQAGVTNVVFTVTDAGSPPLSVTAGLSINVSSSPVQAFVSPTAVDCTTPTTLTCQFSSGMAAYSIYWQARSGPASPWETFEIDSSNGPPVQTTVPPAAFPPLQTTQYRAVVRDSTTCQGISANVSVSGGSTPTIGAEPQDVTVCSGQTAGFSVGTSATTFRWQRSTDGGATFEDVANGAASSHTTPPVTATALYRCVVFGGCGQAVTRSARLNVLPLPAPIGNGLSARRISPTRVNLVWPPSAGATSFRVSRCAAGPTCTPQQFAVVNDFGTDDAAATAPDYWYLVEAVNACGAAP